MLQPPTFPAPHPLAARARVLLSSVFGPYGQDDQYGSRKVNPMELYQNQVTRLQGGFSLRMFHRSFGLMMIQENLDAPCTLLDFPTLESFTEHIRQQSYDVIGISGIIANVGKVAKMCELVRRYQPGATIVVGGHIANKEGLDQMIDADLIVRGEGVRWFQHYLGQDDQKPIKHPAAFSGFGSKTMGLSLGDSPERTAAILIPSVGCPMGCNFCSTSAQFGGKGKFINFYETGDELYAVMCDIERKLKVRSFFVLDENFLLHRKRALRLLELMAANGKNWSLSVFSSARVLKSYSMDQLLGLGIGFVWMGLEGEESAYDKLKGVDTLSLVQHLQTNGIRVLGSSILGLENHRPEDLGAIIDYAVRHDTVFHQFMLYTPIPGTPLHEKHKREGTLLPEAEFPFADAHGQYRFNYRHPHFKNGEEENHLLDAFSRDFDANGPSLLRLFRVLLNGWQKHKSHSRSVRERLAWEAAPLRSTYAGAVWAMKRYYHLIPQIRGKASILLEDIYAEFGWKTRLIAPLIGRYVFMRLKKEEEQLAAGRTYEPRSFCENNAAALALKNSTTAKRNHGIPQLTPLPQPAWQ
ncbi:MAG: B12-binding domain-containing radical SAM protein [Proteobacteria bacterium]|nr:B12-binding domain-containing radical SAM protein [Pseudomonadota bacterium]